MQKAAVDILRQKRKVEIRKSLLCCVNEIFRFYKVWADVKEGGMKAPRMAKLCTFGLL